MSCSMSHRSQLLSQSQKGATVADAPEATAEQATTAAAPATTTGR